MWVGNGETGATDHEDEGMKRTPASLGVAPAPRSPSFSARPSRVRPSEPRGDGRASYSRTPRRSNSPSSRASALPAPKCDATLASLSTERLALAASWVSKVHARSTLTVEVTTLTNKKVILTDVPSTYSAGELKSRFQDEQGVLPEQQNLWFPVPHGTAGAQPAADFKWWPPWSNGWSQLAAMLAGRLRASAGRRSTC